MSDETVLELRDVRAGYGPVPVLFDVSIHINKGEIVALLGPNGAGKSTTLATVSGSLPVRGGEILMNGRSVNGIRTEKRVKLGISLVPEGSPVFGPMTVMDNLVLGAYSRRGKGRREEFDRNVDLAFRLFPKLKDYKDKFAGQLSGGEQKMVAISRSLMSEPTLLLLDEPSLGLAPMLITELMKRISELREGGLSVFLVEQNARAALRIADRGYVMEGGHIQLEGTAEQLLADERVQRTYLAERTQAAVAG
jgi:branched-chain amino acid transport system ATP-binding protein